MVRTAYSEVDNRNPEQMFQYMEARIEFMKRRILELQVENEALREMNPAAHLAHGAADNKINWGLVTQG